MNVDTIKLHDGTFTLSRSVNSAALTNNHTGETVDVPMGANLLGHSAVGLRHFMATCGDDYEGPRIGDLWKTKDNQIVAVVDAYPDGELGCVPLQRSVLLVLSLTRNHLVKLVGVYPPTA